jgi:hypothetical protein
MACRQALAGASRIRGIAYWTGVRCAGQKRKLENGVEWVNDKILMRIGQALEVIRR